MAAITKIEVRLKTGNRSGASTDGDVYLRIGGREFFLDAAGDHDDFQQNQDITYVLGAGSSINHATRNDPRTPFALHTESLGHFPVSIRFQPENRTDEWNLEGITVTVNPGQGQVQYQALGGTDNLWFGTHSSLVCDLVRA